MLIGTCVRRGAYVTVAVELDAAERPHVVLEEQRQPGGRERRCALERSSFADALRFAETWVLARGGFLGAEAEGLAGSPVDQEVARAMFEGDLDRFVHLPVQQLTGD
jgi:hypothetical protein